MKLTHKMLWTFARKKAKEYPRGWRVFKKIMKNKQYGDDPLNDAWLWFIKGWEERFLDQ